MTYVLFVIGFILLIKGADLLVDGASSIAKRLRISNLVIGLTVVAFGTSAPELVVNVIAGFKGNTDLAIGNIIGSNIANILLILGVASVIYPLTVRRNTIWKEIPLSLLAILIITVMANDVLIDGASLSAITKADGFVLIGFFIIFLYYTVGIAQATEERGEEIEQLSTIKSVIFLLLGLSGLVIGGDFIVRGATQIAISLGMRPALVGLTIVAVGTSLPELAASAMAAYKRQTDIAIGNAVGSNIFNIFWILGISAIIRPLPFQTINNRDLGMAITASVLLFICLFIGTRHMLEKWQGLLFVAIYISYILFAIIKG
jgi:cation:H+ antiporter